MAALIAKKKSFGQRLIEYLERNPGEYDVIFAVGPKKVKVPALRLALMVASPVFEKKFKQVWHDAVVRNDGGIPLPDTDPEAFAIFIKVLVSDDVTAESLKPLGLSTGTILNVLSLSKEYEAPEIEEIFNQLASSFFEKFDSFAKSPEFLKLSFSSLEAILSSDQIPIDEISLFTCVCKWAEAQCAKSGLEKNGENMRLLLGNALFQIRFPLMSTSDFANLVCPRGILTELEEFRVLKFIALSEPNKASYDKTLLEFSTLKRAFRQKRDSSLCLNLLKGLTVADNPAGVCNGKELIFGLKVNHKIAIKSVGFLGPIANDGLFEIQIGLKKKNAGAWGETIATVKTNVLAKQRQVFHVPIEPPFVLDPTYFKDEFDSHKNPHYGLFVNLQGNDTQTSSVKLYTAFRAETDGIGFYCHTQCNQIAEIKFKRLP